MKTPVNSTPHRRGYVSYVLVLSMGIVMLLLLVGTYKAAIGAQEVESAATLRIDYAAKEEAVLRAILPIAANSAMRCMQDDSSSASTPLLWQKIFRSAILQSNAESSVQGSLLLEFGLDGAVRGNPGDATTWASQTFRAWDETSNRYTTPGLNGDLGSGFPVPLQSTSATVNANDDLWPIISTNKIYSTLAEGKVGAPVDAFPEFNLLPYPDIRFGYSEPGQPFVAKRNWWAFRMDLSGHQDNLTGLEKKEREFILSIYEVPSQLAISAEAFTVLGKHADGTDWGANTTISGGVFATRAKVEAGMNLERLSGRRGLDISSEASIGNNPIVNPTAPSEFVTTGGSYTPAENPFQPGVRELYELTYGSFMPVSLASETGRASFIPINRGVDFFDRYAHQEEDNMLSDTSWNDYSVGALQCAMHLDITDTVSATDSTPRELTLHYKENGVEETMVIDLNTGPDQDLPPGYIDVADENETVYFAHPVDVAYGKNGDYAFQYGVTGDVRFSNGRFGDPLVGVRKRGFYRPSYPFELTFLHDTKPCIRVMPERMPAFLELIGADDTSVNHSISVNVDYVDNLFLSRPSIPCTELDYGVILDHCADLTPFPKGFSVVTNLRLYIADDFNTHSTTPPAGSGITDTFYPPCSLFAPEKRYGAENNPYRLKISGQMGSLAGDVEETVHLMDMKTATEGDLDHDKVEVNLAPITHPGALPPITMMNWLVVIEERRSEFHSVTSTQP